MQREIVLPETKPALEWILGRAVQKVSPKRRHSLLQSWWSTRLTEWARGRGEVGPEWRFRIAPPGEVIRPLVPDVAFLSYERMGDASEDELETPLMAPNVAVEILSTGDKRAHVRHKIEVYLATGADAIVVVDPHALNVSVHDRDGATIFASGNEFTHDSLPGFRFAIDDMFDAIRLRKP
jgi:Uma2 family endonuclease